MRLLITRRANDYMVHEVEKSEAWECGRTPQEALETFYRRRGVDPASVTGIERNNGGFPTFENTNNRRESPL